MKEQLSSYQSEIAELKEGIAGTVRVNEDEILELKHELDKLKRKIR